jgi:hypothetical protein
MSTLLDIAPWIALLILAVCVWWQGREGRVRDGWYGELFLRTQTLERRVDILEQWQRDNS